MPRTIRAALAATLLAAALVAPGIAPADPFFARNRLLVYSTPEPGVMEVLSLPGTGGSEFFCAAGEYARGPLRARATDRVVVVEPVGPSRRFDGRDSVFMAVVPRGTPLPRQTGLLLDPSYVGENLSVAHAQFLCNSQNRRGRRFF